MFPLDALDAWPRLYGPGGFVQYQLVLPRGQQSRVLEELIARLRRSRVPCYLAALKDLGPASGAPLSFPLAGWTLALDLPRCAPGLEPLLRGFDELVAARRWPGVPDQGRHVWRPDAVAAMYPRLAHWRAVRDARPRRLWRSDLALRTGLVGASGERCGLPRVLLVGGSSEIGVAIVRRLRPTVRSAPVLLGRDRERLEAAGAARAEGGARWRSRSPTPTTSARPSGGRGGVRALGGFDVVVIAIGCSAPRPGSTPIPREAAEVMRVNFLGAGSLLLHCLRALRAQGSGTLVVLSTVAAERPRAATRSTARRRPDSTRWRRGSRTPPRQRRARARGPPGIRDHADDRRACSPRRWPPPPRRSPRRPSRHWRQRAHHLGTGAAALGVCFAEAHAPSAVSEASAVTRSR